MEALNGCLPGITTTDGAFAGDGLGLGLWAALAWPTTTDSGAFACDRPSLGLWAVR